jgi:hypothetical protein
MRQKIRDLDQRRPVAAHGKRELRAVHGLAETDLLLHATIIRTGRAWALRFVEAQFTGGVSEWRPTATAQVLGWLFVLIVLGSAVSTLLECGFGPCPDNPTGYELLQK